MSSFSKADLKLGASWIAEKRIGNLFFSEGTYQVEVVDPKEKATYWPFLQLDDSGKLLDCFCTCKTKEKKKYCPHLAAAYLAIFRDKPEPLHVRFRESLWNQLCQMASHRHGYETSCLKANEGYHAISATGKELFYIKALTQKGKKRLETIVTKRKEETEETSLKFSNLSQQELALWKQGRPSHQLRYELSFWSDFAKWWMLLQEEEKEYTLTFSDEVEGLPKWITISFKDFVCGFYIAEVNWPKIIPTLTTVNSPLKVSLFSYRMIEKITYDPEQRLFLIDFSSSPEDKENNQEIHGIEVGEWLFVRGKGFYPARLDPLFKERVIPTNRIASFLRKHPKIVQKYLVGTTLQREKIPAHYHLFFNGDKALHITCYLFEIGDLSKERSAYFGPWVYLDGKGFYELDNILFEGVEKIVPKALISDFVSRHRHWLQKFEGFETHLSSVESHLTYQLLPDETLSFDTRLEFVEEVGEIHDFGEWIYVKGKGFYAKVTGRAGSLLRAGMRISRGEISRFIQTHRGELEQIPGFFGSRSPIERSGLNIGFNEKGEIQVLPTYFFRSNYDAQKVRFFGYYTFVENEGFYEITEEHKLPEAYSQAKVIDSANETPFVAYELDILAPFILSIDPRLKKPKSLFLKIGKLKRDRKAKTGQWKVALSYETEFGEVPVYEIWRAQSENKRYLFTPAGLIIFRPPRFNWLKSLTKRRWLNQGKELRLTTLEWLRLTVFEEIKEPAGPSREAQESRSLLEELRNFQTPEPLDLTGLRSNLRPYQETGARWLWFLYTNGLSGLLCDEMGLGKTHQAMALLCAVYNLHKESKKGKFLVVCPTSVIFHWEELLKNFLPEIRVSVFYGMGRKLENEGDLILTSYGILRSEKKALGNLKFDVAIFDETQIAKNPRSQTHKAIRALEANFRLGLTGTPIENRLLELKALFDVVLPGYLPTEALFKEMFVNPIEKSQDPEKKYLLSRLIRPFILRRKKQEVLLELPEKIEEVAYCPLSDEQKELYRKTYLEHKEALERDLHRQEKPLPYVHIFSLLSKLKQICDHPSLFAKEASEYKKHASGKWDLFVELLQETRDSGQKLVVFSQYLDMLNIIEAHLTENKIGFAGIRGSTQDRKAQLDKFKNDPKCEVFVASLQAAGVGVDLVSASVVIHYDRWWNPAKENQATDRVHRIGQKRGVQVFKMVTKGTIEEHIHQLILKKMTLMEGVIGFDEQDQIKGLSREELVELMRQLSTDVERP